jgi:hypothetical protein
MMEAVTGGLMLIQCLTITERDHRLLLIGSVSEYSRS